MPMRMDSPETRALKGGGSVKENPDCEDSQSGLLCRTISYLSSFSVHDLVYSYLVHRTDSSLYSYQVM